MIRGKSYNAIVRDIAEGYLSINPLFLKPFDAETLRELYQEVQKVQKEIRAEKFPFSDAMAIRVRNMRLQRLFSASMIIRNFAKERRILTL